LRCWKRELNSKKRCTELVEALPKGGDKVYLQIDFTSERDNFLILVASVLFSGKAIPLYFSMRNYPKKKGQYNQKKHVPMKMGNGISVHFDKLNAPHAWVKT